MGKHNQRGKPIQRGKRKDILDHIPFFPSVVVDSFVPRSLEVPLILKRTTDTGLDVSEWANALIFGQEKIDSRVYDIIMNNEIIPHKYYVRWRPPEVMFMKPK